MGEYWWQGGRGWGVAIAVAVSGMLVVCCLALSLFMDAASEHYSYLEPESSPPRVTAQPIPTPKP
jgi:hypothetical protein